MLPGARLAVVEQTAHCPQEEVPDTFVGVVSDFLRDVDGGAGKERGLVGEEKGA